MGNIKNYQQYLLFYYSPNNMYLKISSKPNVRGQWLTFLFNFYGMFGYYFFPLFSVFKNNFLFLRLKNLFGNSKWVENKNCFQNSIYEGN